MPLTSTIDSMTVPFSMSSGNLLRHTLWMVSHSLNLDRSEACFHATSGASGTSMDPESFAMCSVLPVAFGALFGGLLGLLLHLADRVGVLALRLLVDEVAGLVDRHLDLVGVLRQQVFCLIQESHCSHPSSKQSPGILLGGRRSLAPQPRPHAQHPGSDPPRRLDRGGAQHTDPHRGRRHH